MENASIYGYSFPIKVIDMILNGLLFCRQPLDG